MTNSIGFGFDYLYECCLYSFILHAISNLRFPTIAYVESWDDVSYSFHHDSSRGTVSFDLANRTASGAMRNEISHRRSIYPAHDSIELFEEAPEAARDLADREALQYLFDNIDGVEKPIATTAMWCVGDQAIIVYNDYEDFRANGGEFIHEILLPHDELREFWNEEFEYSPEELELSDRLFDMAKERNFSLPHDLIGFIDKKAEGYDEFIISLEEIGFTFQ